jgi:hypothetical protein
MCLINVASSFQRFPEICVVVDFTVVGDVKRAIFIGHRLMTCSNVNDAEPPVAETYRLVDKYSLIVRTTVSYHIAHAFKHCRIDATSRAA